MLLDTGSNAVQLSHSYEPYGETLTGGSLAPSTRRAQASMWDAYGFNAEDYDAGTGMSYLRARYLSIEVGAFITEDTVKGNIFNPASLNLRGYVEGNPVAYTDPSGHAKCSPTDSMMELMARMLTIIALVKAKQIGVQRTIGDFLEEHEILAAVLAVTRDIVEIVGGAAALYAALEMLFVGGGVTVGTGGAALATGVPEVALVVALAATALGTALVKIGLSGFSEDLQNLSKALEKGSGAKGRVPDKAYKIADEIKNNNGLPPEGYKGGELFRNEAVNGGQKLPDGTAYREYDINPQVSGQNRGAERIVIGDDGSVWYTNNHYQTFTRID
ncbi:MAG: hypothetical protein LBN26_04185 [Christensenellaceae bacterium]|jgi:RHS repeat-associated protein|nr:hypothetical protein [Christensenellaceae bacterium]